MVIFYYTKYVKKIKAHRYSYIEIDAYSYKIELMISLVFQSGAFQ